MRSETRSELQQIIGKGYAQWVMELVQRGWKAYLLTFMFNRIRGSRVSVLRQMEKEVERVYATMLTRIFRKPNAKGSVGKLPVWIVCPDYPVPKHNRDHLRDIALNDGLHMHGLAVVPPDTRLQVGLDQHLQHYQGLYLGRGERLLRVQAKPITTNPDYVTEYALKSVHRRRASLDDVIILPRARSEVRSSDRI